jgi:uncharacterized protein
LLAGRAFVYHLYSLSCFELNQQFDLDKALHWGTLPKIFSLGEDSERNAFLRSYGDTYLKEEIWNEQVIRKLPPFRRFLEVAAQCNGKIINYANIARDVGVDDKTIKEYFFVLEDTMIGFFLEPYHNLFRGLDHPFSQSFGQLRRPICRDSFLGKREKAIPSSRIAASEASRLPEFFDRKGEQGLFRKRLVEKPKFYFFDTGIVRSLSRRLSVPLVPKTSAYGEAFEHFILLEFIRLGNYFQPEYRFSFIRTPGDVEVDLVVERPGKPLLCIEIKSSDSINENDIGSFIKITKDIHNCEAIVLSQDPYLKKFDHVTCYPWKQGIAECFPETLSTNSPQRE